MNKIEIPRNRHDFAKFVSILFMFNGFTIYGLRFMVYDLRFTIYGFTCLMVLRLILYR